MSQRPPFHTFKVKESDDYSSYLYHIEKLLGDDMFLAKVVRNCNRWERWRVCRFVYEEGIGGREVVSTNRVEFCRIFPGDEKPSDPEVIAILERIASDKIEFFKVSIEVVD